MKATQPLSDKSIKADPSKAATWFLQFEKAIESILRLGDRTTSLGMQCFNAATIYKSVSDYHTPSRTRRTGSKKTAEKN